jgi:predicted ferric reductase
MRTKTLIAWIGIFIISILPALLLFALGPGDYSSITHTLGQVSGLIGMTMFSLTFILSTRARWIENIFDGLDKVYPVHSVLGATSFVLILLHPLLLVMKYIPENMQLAAKYLLPGGLLSVDFGIFALLGMIILLMITLYSHFRYHNWKFSHKFLGIFFILAALHVFLVRGNVSRDYIFQGYYTYAIIVSLIGLCGIVYSLVRINLVGKKYVIQKIIKINDCFEIILKPVGVGIKFRAGQFVFVSFLNASIGDESHPFSIASATGSDTIRIIAKNLGDYTSQLGKLKAGNYAIIEGPYGKFHKSIFTNEVWVAGGIGITPFLGLAADFNKSDSGHVDLYYTVKNNSEFVHLEELQDIARSNKNFRVFPWVSDQQGHLTISEIGSLKGKKYFLCGPEGLKSSIRKSLLEKNVSNENIRDERFAFK